MDYDEILANAQEISTMQGHSGHIEYQDQEGTWCMESVASIVKRSVEAGGILNIDILRVRRVLH